MPDVITSTHNPRVQWVRKLQSRSKHRAQSGAFVAEGVRLAEEALAAGWQPQLAFYTEELDDRGRAIVEQLLEQEVVVEAVSPQVMSLASDTKTPQGILLVLLLMASAIPEALDFLLIADQVRDPGNLGTMLRSAAAAGASAVIVTPGTADPFAPKVVRAGMGAHFHLPVVRSSWPEIRTLSQAKKLNLYLAAAGEGVSYTEVDMKAPVGLVVGGEAEGADLATAQIDMTKIHVPMPGRSESLNAAMAASILLFEVVRQRRSRT
jgi:TrmH family RNA methyltransferase